PDAGNNISALRGALLTPIINQNMISVDKSAPLGTFIEIELIKKLRAIIGYVPTEVTSAIDVGGVATVGGVAANATALLVARTIMLPESRKRGVINSRVEPYLLIADYTLSHYSHKA